MNHLLSRGKFTAFLSHTGRDTTSCQFTVYLKEKAESLNIPCFCDYASIPPATPWAKYIEKAVTECQAFVAILSPEYFRRYWCMHELDLAIQHSRPVLPVYYSLSGPEEFPDEGVFCDFFKNDRRLHTEEGVADMDRLHRWWRNINQLKDIQDLRRGESTGKGADLVLQGKVIQWLQSPVVANTPWYKLALLAVQALPLLFLPYPPSITNQQQTIAPPSFPHQILNSLRGVKGIRFCNKLQQAVHLWVYESHEQLAIYQDDAENLSGSCDRQMEGASVPHTAFRLITNYQSGNGGATVQAVIVAPDASMFVYAQSKHVLVTFAIRDSNSPTGRNLLVLQHRRQVPINHAFTFHTNHTVEPLWENVLSHACRP